MANRGGYRYERKSRLSQRFTVENQQAAPGLLRQRFVIDLRIGRAPAVCGTLVYLDLGRQLRLRERLFQGVLVRRRFGVVTGSDCNEKLRVTFRGLQMRTVRILCDEAAAVECGHRANAVWHRSRGTKRHRAAHAVALRT